MVIVEQFRSDFAATATLRQMFQDRKSIFVDLLRWDLAVLDDQFEVDAFDDEYATYVVIAGTDGEHLGSARLLPTTRKHILGDLFPSLCAGPPPRGEKIFEITRFCLSRRQNAAGRLQTRNQLVSALAWYALESGIATYTGVAEIAWLQQILAFGWDCRPLGLPQRFDCGILGALAIEITTETARLLAQNDVWSFADETIATIAEAA